MHPAHSDPGDVALWSRKNGSLTLTLEPYTDRKTLQHLYPFGSIPRLLLFWIVTEATQKKSRHIQLGNSLDAFMREIGLKPRTGGREARWRRPAARPDGATVSVDHFVRKSGRHTRPGWICA